MAGSQGEIASMEDLLLHGLQDMYYAENQILKSMPQMIEKASNPKLKQMIEQHQKETQGQIERLKKVFEMHGQEPRGKECPAMDGIIREGQEVMQEVQDPELRDVAIVGAAQAIEHYEITRYGTMTAWAQEMKRRDVAKLFKEILEQEKATDKKLNQMAESRVNPKASGSRSGSSGSKRASGGGSRKKAAAARKSGGGRRSASTGRKSSSSGRKTQSKRKAASRKRA